MLNTISISDELGTQVGLLGMSDQWLAAHKLRVSCQLSSLAHEWRSLDKAGQLKRELQQTNRVAVRHLLESEHGVIEVIDIMPLREAVATLLQEAEQYKQDAYLGQLGIWRSDGYDVGAVLPKSGPT